MANVKCIIVEISYLIKKGLVSILNEFKEIKIEKAFENLEDAISFLEKSEIDIIFTEEKHYTQLSQQLFNISSNEKKQRLIKITHHNISQLDKTSNTINIYEDKNEILQKLDALISRFSKTTPKNDKDSAISKREETILKYIALGLTNKEIAEKLFLSSHTVVTHRKNIAKKLGIRTVSGLTIYAILNNIISTDDIQ